MNGQDILIILFTAVLTIIGWLARNFWFELRLLKFNLSVLQQSISKTYVDLEHYREDMRDLKTMLDKLLDRINAKFDKITIN